MPTASTTSTAPTGRSPRRDATENRAALLAAARVVLNRDPDAGLDAIAAEAGLTRRAVYGHFANRDALLKELVTTGAARVAASLAGVDHPDPLVRLALIASQMWQEVDSVRVMTLFAVRGPFQGLVAEQLRPVRAQLLGAVRHRARPDASAGSAASRSRVRTDIDPETLARLIEGAAIAVLDEATRAGIPADAGRRLAMLTVLSVAGLDAASAGRLIDETPELGGAAR
ncbi:TetR/AcrR family transcriptional regulator [Lysinimonas soli]|uniref:TetR/AcrR family transcriptional regulator n=1 Tax=Lysinimonas soli TaxID=1074233 RepID=A0ABW0NSF9_9MICO